MLNDVLLVILALAGAGLAALLYGAYRWHTGTKKLRTRLDAARVAVRPHAVDFRELEGLPAPVQRYFRAVLEEGQPLVGSVHVRHRGTFNLSPTADAWKPFTSDQKVVTRRPGFDWDGRVAVLPGLPVRIHDAYVAGEGILHASLLGLFSLVRLHGTADAAEGELMRFFAEAAWYPTALLPSQDVRWEAGDDRSAYGTLTDGNIALTMLFCFGDDGLIHTVRAQARGRNIGGTIIPTPWQGRFWNYHKRGTMQVPLDAEVAWLLPEGERPYWRGRITRLVYELAG
jgi:hypothetical protein